MELAATALDLRRTRAGSYERRRPETTTLYAVVRDNVETLYAAVAAGFGGAALPPSLQWIESDLKQGDAESLDHRIARYRFVAERFPIGQGPFTGGAPQVFAFQEMQRSYISANYMAVVPYAQVFAEHTFAAPYAFGGEDSVVVGGFAKLIDWAKQDGEITEQTAERLHVLRRMRNPYTHPNVDAKGHDGRMVPGKHPLESLKDDAEVALGAVVALVGRRPSSSAE